MTTFLCRTDPPAGDGPLLAVKDIVDIAGLVTTAACRPVADRARPADHDAAVIVRARASGARIVGKTNLHELAFGGTGVNEAFGTPVNPLDPRLIPGGSSSGSAVAVATGEADVAIGTDTAGSIRTPSACCGTVGLKTTFGRIPTEGVRPLAPTLDTVGPMARTVAGVTEGMKLLEPGFEPLPTSAAPTTVARLRLPGVDPAVDSAVDRALDAAGVGAVTVDVDGWEVATEAGILILLAEAAVVNATLAREHCGQLGHEVQQRIALGSAVTAVRYRGALEVAAGWRRRLATILERHTVLAMPTLPVLAPPLSAPHPSNGPHSAPVNLAGVPALALPVPTDGPIPASVQLVGSHGSEDLLLATGTLIEAAVAASSGG